MKKYTFLPFLLIISLFFAAACSNSTNTQSPSDNQSESNSEKSTDGTPKYGGELKFAQGSAISNLDPLQGNSGHDHISLFNLYDTLTTWDKDLQLQPGLAESWDVPDETTIILHLREGVTFHDGTPFDAEAVKINLERANSDQSKVSDLINVESIEILDTYTVQLNLSQPDSSILMALSDRAGMMVSPKAIENGVSMEDFVPIGTGPFKYESWVPNGELVLVRNENYWQEGKPYLDKLTIIPMTDENTRINALTSGQIDIAFPISTNNIPTLDKNNNISLISNTQIQSWQVYINIAKPPLDNVKLRQALLYAVDRGAMNEAILFGLGEPAHQHFPEGYWAHNPDVRLEYDPEKAKQLIEESGLKDIEIEIVYQSTAFSQKLMESLKSQLAEVGVNVKLIPMELTKGVTEFFTEKRYNAGMWPWTGRPDPQITLQSLWGDTGYFNAGGQNSDKLEEIIKKSAATYEDREEVIHEAVRIAIEEDAMNLPLLFEPSTAAISKKVEGFEGNLAGKPKLAFLWLNE